MRLEATFIIKWLLVLLKKPQSSRSGRGLPLPALPLSLHWVGLETQETLAHLHDTLVLDLHS